MNLTEIAVSALLGAAGAGGGVWALMAARTKAGADVEVAEVQATPEIVAAAAALQEALNAAAKNVVAGLERQVSDLNDRVDGLKAEHAQCLGENAQLKQRIDSLERQLAERGALPPSRPPEGSAIILEGDAAMAIVPERARPAPPSSRNE